MSSHGFHPFKGQVSRHFRSESRLSPEDAYLSYYDIRLTKEDYDCMRNDWLTDNAIAFYEEYVEHEHLPRYPAASIVLLRPSMCFLLNQTEDPQTLKSALPDFSKATHIFLPINDNRSPDAAEGGSHWSLLLVSVLDGCGFHYDSLRPSNGYFANLALGKLRTLLPSPDRPLRFVEMEGSPQQHNGSDCGVFVTMCMRYLLLHRLLTSDTKGKVSMSMGEMELDAGKGRRELMGLVEEFRREGRRSASRSRSHGHGHGKSPSPPRVGD